MNETYEDESTTSASEVQNYTDNMEISDQFEEQLYDWYSQCLNRQLSINDAMVKKKASSLAEQFGEETMLRKGWLNCWRQKYGILQFPIINKATLPPSTQEAFDVCFKKLIKDENITSDQIFTCSETGLYYKMLPTSELIYYSQMKIPNFDVTSSRVTVFACCNASGTMKLPLLLVDKVNKPQALQNFKLTNLPLNYQYQKSAWVDTSIFQKWFDSEFVPRVNKFLQEKELPQKAILIIDNAPLHASEERLRCGNIRSTLLNINVLSITRSINQEIMRDLKIRYRYRLLLSLLEYQFDGKDIMQRLKEINIKDVIYWLADAWSDVSPVGIQRIWERLWHRKKYVHFEEDDSMSILELMKLCLQIQGCKEVNKKDVEKLMNRDNKAMYNLSDEEIIEIVLQNKKEEEPTTENDSVPPLAPREAQDALDILITFFETQNVSPQELVILNRLRNRVKCHKVAEPIFHQSNAFVMANMPNMLNMN